MLSCVPSNLTTLRRQLQRHRLECDLTLEALSKAIGRSPPTIMRFMDGLGEPHARTVHVIEKYLQQTKDTAA
jgi:predicted transcriptional regulator